MLALCGLIRLLNISPGLFGSKRLAGTGGKRTPRSLQAAGEWVAGKQAAAPAGGKRDWGAEQGVPVLPTPQIR